MAIIKKYNPKKIYLSARVKDRLATIFEHPVTIVEAPTGYGKSTIVKEYLKNSEVKFVWFHIDSDDKEQFIADFSARVKNIRESVSNTIKKIGYPTDTNAATRIANELLNISFEKPMVLVLDNFHYISDVNSLNIVKDIARKNSQMFRLVCLTQEITNKNDFELSDYGNFNYIGKSDFALNKAEIDEYYRQSGIKLDEDEIEILYNYSEGWICALYLQLLNFEKTNNFAHTISARKLVSRSIWEHLSDDEQDFLISMSVFPDFTARQAAVMSKGYITNEARERLLDSNGFISYDAKEKKYRFHTMLKRFLENEFNKLEPYFRKCIYKSAGDWYASNDNVYIAMKYYKKIGDYESILAMDWPKANLSDKLKKDDKDTFMEIVLNTSYDIKKKYIRNYLVFVFLLFVLNERACFKKECDFIREYISSKDDITNIEKEDVLGEVEFLYAFVYYNDIQRMNRHYKKAFEYLKSPSKLFRGTVIFNFECPSILGLFHSKPGHLEEELAAMDEMMPSYYKLTEGDFKGMEALMRAEAMFNQGNIKDAKMLCDKAKYMAESRAQTNVYISILLLEARIAIFDADYDRIHGYVSAINELSESENRYMLTYMSDLCQSYIYANLNDMDNISSWLKDSTSIESRASILNLGYANIIYSKYLLSIGEYEKFLAISGQLLDIAGIFSNVMYKIYTYIFMAIAKYHSDDTEKAIEFITEALKLAAEDDIIMPFVEQFSSIETIIDRVYLQKNKKQYSDIIDKIRMLIKKYNRGVASVKKAARVDRCYGLTKRELDVAKLAAQRYTNKEIADMLFIAESTVKSNLKIIFNKLSIKSRNELRDYFT